MAWSPDGRRLAAGCGDNLIRVWDAETGAITRLQGHTEVVSSVDWAPDGRLASGSADKTVRIWNVDDEREIARASAHSGFVRCVAWLGNETLASGGEDDQIFLWDRGGKMQRIDSGEGWVLSLAYFRPRHILAVGCATGVIQFWRLPTLRPFARLKGHKKWVDSVAWSRDGRTIISGSGDQTVRLWNTEKFREIHRMEAHTKQVRAVAISADGSLLASKADDGRVAFWGMPGPTPVPFSVQEKKGHTYWPPGIAFHPSELILATPGDGIRIWDFDVGAVKPVAPAEEPVKYVAAKIALVGESGVGKTSLGWRLAHGKYQSHPSTHGQQFWVVDQLRTRRADNTECEAVLWDFAGQPDYRLVHALFMDDVDLALVLFDPTRSLEGVRYWLKQLPVKDERRQAILVAARADRGASTLTGDALQAFCAAEGVTAGYVATSALTGEGLDTLLERLKSGIAWESMPATITTATFKRVKEHVLTLKEQRGATFLITPEELRQRLQKSDASWQFTDAEMMTAVKHLATHGYVSALRASDGREVILLAPELLANVASSIVLEARRNPKGLGAVDEAFILHGDFQPRELETLSPADRTLLVDAAVMLFLEHNVCFRQTVGAQTFLIFPALINEKRPQLASSDVIEYVSYRITGAVENVYASLVVQLGYTGTFARTNQWQNQAEYETPAGDLCGFRQAEEAEGQIELVLYHARDKPNARVLFQELVEMFLRGREVTVQKFPAVICGNCGYRPQRAEIISRITAQKDHLFCGNCGTRLPLIPAAQEPAAARHPAAREEGVMAARRTNFEAALVRIKAIVRDQNLNTPSCFLSYARGNPAEERWVWQLAEDLEHAGVDVVLDQKDNQAISANIARFIERIAAADFVAIIGTPRYLVKYQNKVSTSGSIVAAEVDLINLRLVSTEEMKSTVLPLLLEGEETTALPPLARGRVYADFREQANYFRAVFDLALTMYRIGHNAAAVADVRETLAGGVP